MQSYEPVSSPIERGLIQVLQRARETLFITTPYIKDYGVDFVLNNTQAKTLRLLTNLEIANVTGLAFDVSALLKLWDKFTLEVSSMGKLHAKVYMADNKVAFVTSANLTRGGLRENYEYGVILRDEQLVSTMLADMNAYFRLGNVYSRETIEDLKSQIEEIRGLQHELENSAEARRLRKALKQKEDILQTKILANRVRGKTINAIFSQTIEYLLGSRGAMSTQELHPLIQDIHPDICDDTIDRVINGQHFGKKWKHFIRNAQQSLCKSGKIYLRGGKWYLSDSPNQTFGR
ncbi:MAG: phospholipase D-like domain-containing protein [Planctomycetota bacterium]